MSGGLNYPAGTFIHPGVIFTGLVTSKTDLEQRIIKLTASKEIITAEEGTRNALWAATARKENITNGAYYEPIGEQAELRRKANVQKLARKLWEWTDKELEKYTL